MFQDYPGVSVNTEVQLTTWLTYNLARKSFMFGNNKPNVGTNIVINKYLKTYFKIKLELLLQLFIFNRLFNQFLYQIIGH